MYLTGSRETLKEGKMLTNLSLHQVEQALAWLASPIQESPPQELEELGHVEWFLLDRMLQALKAEQEHSPVH
jgi:hypothetical protein